MRFAIDLDQLRGIDMSVALGRAEARVAEQLLDGPEVGAALQQVRRERVTQGVRADSQSRAALRDVPPQQAVDAASGQPAAAGIRSITSSDSDSSAACSAMNARSVSSSTAMLCSST